MFICSVRASTLKFFAFVFLAAALVFGIVGFSADASVDASVGVGSEVNFGGIKTKEDRLAFISGFGIQTTGEEMSGSFVVPKSLDRVILGYNEIQKKQGLDVSKYTRKKIVRYTYEVTNFNTEGKVYANLFIYRNRIIACDVSSIDGQFVYPMTKLPGGLLK
jgi:hypothetical protein